MKGDLVRVSVATMVASCEVKRLVHVAEEADQKFERILYPARYVVVVVIDVPSRLARCLKVLQHGRGGRRVPHPRARGQTTLG